jgi:predicted Ser/Thr protein kinase
MMSGSSTTTSTTTGGSGTSTVSSDTDAAVVDDDDNVPYIIAGVVIPLALICLCLAVLLLLYRRNQNRKKSAAAGGESGTPMKSDSSSSKAGGGGDASEDDSAHDDPATLVPTDTPEHYANIPPPSDAGMPLSEDNQSYYSVMPGAPKETPSERKDRDDGKHKKHHGKSSSKRRNKDGEYYAAAAATAAAADGAASNDRPAAATRSGSSRRSTASGTSSITRRKSTKYVIDPSELKRFEMVGKGAFGEVYRGEWRHVDVAVKDVKNVDALSDLLREAEELKSLQPHRNVVEFYGIVAYEGSFSLVTAFAAKGALSNLLYGKNKMAFSREQLHSISLGSAAGVRHLHAEGVIHRDLAARNILIDDTMTPKIADFGMSRQVAADSDEDNTTMQSIGPVKWQAPEQMTRRAYSRASDVFAFGVVLYEIFTASPPWAGLAPLEVATKVMGGQTLEMPASVDKRISAIAMQCWQREPNDRPEMKDVHASLSTAFAGIVKSGGETGQVIEIDDDESS